MSLIKTIIEYIIIGIIIVTVIAGTLYLSNLFDKALDYVFGRIKNRLKDILFKSNK